MLGQSNAVGKGEVLHRVLGRSLSWHAVLGIWRPAHDPLRDDFGAGSPYPILGDAWESIHGVPIAFVPAAIPGAGLVDPPDWQGAVRDLGDATLVRAGGVDVVLWLQGETDACHGVDRDAYREALVGLAEDVQARFGAPMVVALISPWITACPLADVRTIRLAQSDAAAESDAICALFDTSALGHLPDGMHFRTDSQMEQLAVLWRRGLEACGFAE